MGGLPGKVGGLGWDMGGPIGGGLKVKIQRAGSTCVPPALLHEDG